MGDGRGEWSDSIGEKGRVFWGAGGPRSIRGMSI
jgi:hypothetical protein